MVQALVEAVLVEKLEIMNIHGVLSTNYLDIFCFQAIWIIPIWYRLYGAIHRNYNELKVSTTTGIKR